MAKLYRKDLVGKIVEKERLKQELNSDLVAVYDISEGGYSN